MCKVIVLELKKEESKSIAYMISPFVLNQSDPNFSKDLNQLFLENKKTIVVIKDSHKELNIKKSKNIKVISLSES